jgi:hypothetical protein
LEREAEAPPFFDFNQRWISAMDRNDFQALLRLRHELAGMRFEIALEQFRRKYSDSQPRVPAGQPGGGQWVGGDGGEGGPGSKILLAGNLEKLDPDINIGQFISENCQGKIHREMPGQFYGMTIGEMLELRNSGDRAADTCYKLLDRGRFRK